MAGDRNESVQAKALLRVLKVLRKLEPARRARILGVALKIVEADAARERNCRSVPQRHEGMKT